MPKIIFEIRIRIESGLTMDTGKPFIHMRGSTLREVIEIGLSRHEHHLTLTLDRTLQEFSDSLISDREYDLFSCFAELILKADADAALIIANLMKAVNMSHETLHEHTVSKIGYYFCDYLKKDEALQHFDSNEDTVD